MRHITLTIILALAITSACKRTPSTQGSPNLTAADISGSPPITVGPSTSGIAIGYGFNFRSTLNQPEYRVVQEDCGFVLRSARTEGITITLPLLTFPCALMLFNEKDGPMVVNLEGTAPDGTGGDFNGEKTFTLGNQEGAILHLHQAGHFYRGLYTCRGGYGGCKGGGGTAPPPTPTGTADLTDFKATQVNNKRLDIAAGSFAIGSYSFPATSAGSIEFTAGTGDAKVYMSKLGILTTEGAVGTTGTMTGQMVLLTTSTPSFPPGSIPICDLALSNGTYTIDSCGLASRVRGYAVEGGPGIQISYTQGVARISTDATVARTDAPSGAVSTTAYTVMSWFALIISIAALTLSILHFKGKL